jgi:glycosyltransferase involved in cell wall biosynthesis
MPQRTTKLRIGILAHEFLINIGANDFLKNVIRGLASESQNEIVFLCPRSNERIEHIVSAPVKEALKNVPYLKQALRAVTRHIGPVTDRVIKSQASDYAFYAEACPRMEFATCEMTADALTRFKEAQAIDVFIPSIHVLPTWLPYVSYWPDCQPKHYPEYFDAEAQRVRDERILGLLASGKPMIINSRAAKADMQRFYDADASQIFDLPFAPIVECSKLTPRPELLRPYGLTRKYFIVCNQLWVHKSTETVIEAARIAKQRGMDVEIALTGRMEEPRKPGYIDQLRQMVIDLDVADTVKFLGYIPKDDQLELVKNAVAVVQPTLFEGGPGGGSVYDAVSLGVRAIVSDIPINHELPLAADRLVLFKTRDPQDLVDKMAVFLDTQHLTPSPEDLYQQSKRSTARLAKRLYEAIDCALSTTQTGLTVKS